MNHETIVDNLADELVSMTIETARLEVSASQFERRAKIFDDVADVFHDLLAKVECNQEAKTLHAQSIVQIRQQLQAAIKAEEENEQEANRLMHEASAIQKQHDKYCQVLKALRTLQHICTQPPILCIAKY